MNLADELGRQAQLRPDAVAVSLPNGDLCFRELEDLSWRVATYLHRNGVAPGAVVALSFSDELALLVTLFATAHIGATAISLPDRLPALLRNEMAARARVRHLVSDHASKVIAGVACLMIDIGRLKSADAPVDVAIRVDAPSAPWLMISGSGSTGHPRLFAVSHQQFLARARLAGDMLGLSPGDRLASLAHPDFTSPKERYLAALFAGASIVLFERNRTHPVALCRDRHVTILDATVFHIERLLGSLPDDARNRLASLRVLQISASTVSDGLRRRIAQSLGPTLHVRYGTNETGPLTIVRPDGVLGTPGTVGLPPSGVQIEVVDPRGQPLPAGHTGLIRVISPGMIDRYLDDEEATRRAFGDGWFMPGDLGRFAPNGHLIFCGRADHMMIMNGINIYPAEIERVVSLHPAVLDTAVIPLQSAVHQDVPTCAVVLHPEKRVTEAELLAFAAQRLGSHGPQRVVVLERIPRNEQGKLLRAELMQRIAGKFGPGVASRPLPLPARSLAACKPRPRQPLHQAQLAIHCGAAVDLATIDDWLAVALKIVIEPCNCPSPPPWQQGDTHALTAELAWRVLLLNRVLLQAAGVPVFDPGCVLGVERNGKDPATWVAAVATAHVEELPPRCLTIARDEAIRLIEWIAGKPRTPEHMATLFDDIQKRVLPALKRGIMSGKSTLHVLRAAHTLDIPFSHLGAGVYQLGWGDKSMRVDRSTTELDSAIGSKLAQNKVWTASLIRTAGLPAPQHGVAATHEEAIRLAHRMGWPVVVKPLDRDRGEGITVGIASEDGLQAAFKTAKRLSRGGRVIVEREVPGVCHRLFIADGRLLYAVKRWPKSIHGDGQHTITELIRAANRREDARPPWLRSERCPDDALAGEAIAAAGFTLDAIPAAGKRVPLRTIESTAWGGFDEDVTGRIHPDNLDIALRAATLFGLQVAGIDIITPDIGRPWHENGAIINEVNFAPLLGGGEISRSHIPEFLARLMNGDGRVPIEAIVGGDAALAAARARQQELAGEWINCVVTSHATTLSAAGEEIRFPFASLYRRCKALLLDKRVGAIVLVIQTDELLRSGLPVDRIDRVSATGSALKQSRSADAPETLLTLLRYYAGKD